MGQNHVSALRARRDIVSAGTIHLFLDFLAADDPQFGRDVPDPYYGDMSDYELSLDLIELSTPKLIESLKRDFL